MLKGKGFTLIELMVSLAVISIIFAIALPNYSSFLAQLRVDDEISKLHRSLLITRNTAINSGQRVTLCPLDESGACSAQWQGELSIFVDSNNNNRFDSNNDETLISVKDEIANGDMLLYGKGRTKIIYSPDGHLSGLSNGTFKYCPKAHENLSRGIIIARSGRLYLSADNNGDGIDENRNRKKIVCT